MPHYYIYISLFFILILFYMFIQALSYRTRYFTLPTGTGLRLLHISDIHIEHLYVSPRRMKRTLEKVKPDFLLISGDFLDKPMHLNKLVRWLKKIEINVPVYAVFGNHEYRCFRRDPPFKRDFLSAMEELNIRVLVNEVVYVEKESKTETLPSQNSIALIGIDDCKSGAAVKNDLFSGLREKSRCIVAFSHNPDVSLRIPEGSVDLLLAGHFHGGQIWMPFHMEYLLFRKDRISKMGYRKGFAVIRKNRLYISRGLGTVLFPFRFLSVPEVTVFDL